MFFFRDPFVSPLVQKNMPAALFRLPLWRAGTGGLALWRAWLLAGRRAGMATWNGGALGAWGSGRSG